MYQSGEQCAGWGVCVCGDHEAGEQRAERSELGGCLDGAGPVRGPSATPQQASAHTVHPLFISWLPRMVTMTTLQLGNHASTIRIVVHACVMTVPQWEDSDGSRDPERILDCLLLQYSHAHACTTRISGNVRRKLL
jgi:hypothetical protein